MSIANILFPLGMEQFSKSAVTEVAYRLTFKSLYTLFTDKLRAWFLKRWG